MVTYSTRMAVFLCMFIGLASVGIVSLNPAESGHEPRQHIHGESQHEPHRTEIELRVPATLQSLLQDGDLTSWHAAEELRIHHSLLRFLQQSDIIPSTSMHSPYSAPRQPRTLE